MPVNSIPGTPLATPSSQGGMSAADKQALIWDTREYISRKTRTLSPIAIETGFNATTGYAGAWTTGGLGGSASIVLNDADHYGKGTDCAAITTSGTGNSPYINSPAYTAKPWDLSNSSLVIALKVTSTAALKGTFWATVYAGSDTNASAYTNAVSWVIGDTNDLNSQRYMGPDGTWFLFSLSRIHVDATYGTIDWTSIKAIRIRINDAWVSGGSVAQATVRIGLVGTAADTTASYPNGVATFCFDDGLASAYTKALPIFNARGIGATAFIINDALNTTSFLTTAQVNEMVSLGWDAAIHGEIAAHTSDWPSMAVGDRNAMLDRSVAFHAAQGWDTRHCAYPSGHFDYPTVTSVLGAGIPYARTTYGMMGTANETWPPMAPGKLIATSFGAQSVNALKIWIDRLKTNKTWGIFTLHDVVATASSGQVINQYDLQAWVEYAVAQGVAIRTMSQMLP